MTYKYHFSIPHCMLKQINEHEDDLYTFPKHLNTPSSYIITKLDMQQLFPNQSIYENAIPTMQTFISILKYPYHNPDDKT